MWGWVYCVRDEVVGDVFLEVVVIVGVVVDEVIVEVV